MKLRTSLAGILLLTGIAPAATLTVDSFTDDQTGTLAAGSGPQQNGIAAPGAMGGSRFADWRFGADPGGTQTETYSINSPNADTLDVSNSSNGFGTLLLRYDGQTTAALDLTTVDMDLTGAGTNDQLNIFFKASDHVVNGTITVYTDATHASVISYNTPLAGPGLPFPAGASVILPFAGFSILGGAFTGAADFSHVRALDFNLGGINGFDASLDFIEADSSGAPEPASLALFGSGLAGFALVARRRRS